MVAASTCPGRAAAIRSNNARLSGPPETATPIRPSRATRPSRSAEKRSTKIRSGTIPNRSSTSVALGLRLGVGHLLAQVGTRLCAVDRIELRIDPARLPGLAELHCRLAEIVEAVSGALAPRIPAIVGEKDIGRVAGLAFAHQRSADQVVG